MISNTMTKGLLLAIGLICLVQAVKVEHYGSLYHPQEDVYEKKHEEPQQDFSKIPGVPGVDFPIYHEVPKTSFSCAKVPAVPGMYANVETGCQAYHTCHDGREGHQGASFLCTNGTLYNQKEFTCDWWYNVKCEEATSYYHLNADPEHNPFTPKKKVEEEHPEAHYVAHHEEPQLHAAPQHHYQRHAVPQQGQLHHRQQSKFIINPY